jgi:DNA-binding transcriptional LysR family regulator
VDSLLAAVESGLGVAVVISRATRHVPERVRLKKLAGAPDPLCIAVGCRAEKVGDQPLAVFIEELRKAVQAAS